MKKKRILQIFILLLAVVFLTTSAYAGVKKSHRWWRNPFGSLWSAVFDLQGQINNNSNKLVEMASELNNKAKSTNVVVGPQGPKGDPGPPGPEGPPGKLPRFICGGCIFSGEQKLFVDYNFNGAFLVSSSFIGTDLSGANFTDADLKNASLNDAILVGAFLTGADLSGADMQGANLTGADLTGATLTGVTWTEYDAWFYNEDTEDWEKVDYIAICPNGLPADDASNGGVCQ